MVLSNQGQDHMLVWVTMWKCVCYLESCIDMMFSSTNNNIWNPNDTSIHVMRRKRRKIMGIVVYINMVIQLGMHVTACSKCRCGFHDLILSIYIYIYIYFVCFWNLKLEGDHSKSDSNDIFPRMLVVSESRGFEMAPHSYGRGYL